MLFVPAQSIPYQIFSTDLGGQPVTLRIRSRSVGLYMDVLVNDALIVAGVVCQDRNRIVRDAYLGFIGDLVWVDIRGTRDPDWLGIGDRFFLTYLTPDEVTQFLVVT